MIKLKLFLTSVVLLFFMQNISAQGTMGWVLLSEGYGTGSCVSMTDCDTDILCYGLQYTAEVSGVLTSYTTGFFATCTSVGDPVVFNNSCVMVDNSDVIDACGGFSLVLFNSSGNSGSTVNNTITAGTPEVIHQVCFNVPDGETLTISEDAITDLTTNVDLPNGTSITEFPSYSDFLVDKDAECFSNDIAIIDIKKEGVFNDISGDGFAQVGETVNYTFEVNNLGNVALSNIGISDPLFQAPNQIVPIVYSSGDANTNNLLDLTETWIFTAVYILEQEDINTGAVYNIATASGQDPSSTPVTDISEDPTPIGSGDPLYDPFCPDCTVTITPHNPSISLSKEGVFNDFSGDGYAQVGETINYSFILSNTGNVSIGNVTISDPLFELPNPVVTISGPVGDVSNPGFLDPTETWTYSATYVLTQENIDNGVVYNLATADGDDPNGDPVTDDSSDPTPIDTNDPLYDPSCPDCTVTITPHNPSISILKEGIFIDGSNDGFAQVGEIINYNFTVTNTGNVSISNVVVSDPLFNLPNPIVNLMGPAGDNTNPGVLDLNEVWVYTAIYTLTQSDIDAGAVYNLATVTGNDPNGDPVTDDSSDPTPIDTNDPLYDPSCPECTVTVTPQTPSIFVLKEGNLNDISGDGFAQAGETILYSFIVTNTGNVTLSNVTLTDPLFQSPNPVVTINGPLVDANNDGLMNPAESWLFTAIYVLTQSDIDAGAVYNLATAAGDDPNGNPVSDESTDPTPIDTNDPLYDPSCPDCTVTVTPQNPSINITKEGVFADISGDGYAQAGELVNYVIVVSNTGNTSISNVVISDPLFVSPNPVVSVNGPLGDISNIGVLDINENWIYTASYVLTQADIDAGAVYNLATVNGVDPNGVPLTDDSTDPTPIDSNDPLYDPTCPDCTVTITPQAASVAILKEGLFIDQSGDGLGQPGETVNYTFTVTNTGNVSIHNMVVTDPLFESPNPVVMINGPVTDPNNDGVMTPGEIWIYTAVYTLVQTDIDAGAVYNLATAEGNDPDGDTVTDDSTDPTPLSSNDPYYDPSCPDCTVTTLGQNPAINIVKEGIFNDMSGDGFAQAGEQIFYNFSVSNPGNVVLHNVAISDPLFVAPNPIVPINYINGDVNTNNILEMTEVWTFTAVYTMTQADVDAGAIYNLATADALDPNNSPVTDESTDPTPIDTNDPLYDPSCPDCTVTIAPQNPSIAIHKDGVLIDASADGFAQVGETVNYTFVVTNTGNVSINNVIISDPLFAAPHPVVNISGPIGDNANFGVLDLNESWIYSAIYTLTQSDIDAGAVYNLATVNGDDPYGDPVTDESTDPTPIDTNDPMYDPTCPDCTVIVTPQDPSISILKEGVFVDMNNDGFAEVGETINYIFSVQNTGNVCLNNVVVSDPLLQSPNPVVLISGPTGDVANSGILDVTETWVFTAFYTLTQADIDAGVVYNLATVNGDDPNGDPVTDESTDPTPIDSNDPLYDPACTNCTVTTTPQNPSIIILKEGLFVDVSGDGFAQVGETVSYSFSVSNSGNVSLSNVVITDPLFAAQNPVVLISGPTGDVANAGILDLNETWTYTANYILTQADIDAGAVYNLATVTGNDPNGDPVTDDSTDPTPIDSNDPLYDPTCPDCTVTVAPQDPSIEIYKEGIFNDISGDGFAQAGETINYTFTVNNTGNFSISNVVLSDPLFEAPNPVVNINGPSGDVSNPGILDLNESWIYTAVYTLTQADIDAGTVYNLATVEGDGPNGTPVSDDSEDPTPIDTNDPLYDPACPDCTVTVVPQNPSIEILKDGVFNDINNDGFAQIGETVDYTFSVSNTGNVSLTNVIVSDPLFQAPNELVVISGPANDTGNPGILDLEEIWTFTASYTVTSSDIVAGAVYNLATATGDDPNGDPVTDESADPTPMDTNDPLYDPACPDCTVTVIPQLPEFGLAKSLESQVDNFNDTYDLTFLFTIENFGLVTVNNLAIYDDVLTHFSGMTITNLTAVSGTLNANPVWNGTSTSNILMPGQNLPVQGTATVRIQFTVNPGNIAQVENIAFAQGESPDGNPNQDVATDGTDPDADGNPNDGTIDGDNDPNEDDPTTVYFVSAGTEAFDDINNTIMNYSVEGNVLTNDFDYEGHNQIVNEYPLYFPAHGIVDLDPNGDYIYIPEDGFTGVDSFTYIVCDDFLTESCDTAQVVIVVTPNLDPFNDAPLAHNDVNQTLVNVDLSGDVLRNDMDVDGDELSVNLTLIKTPDHGDLTILSDGTYVYHPDFGFEGVDTFRYEVCDDGIPSLCAEANVIIEVLSDEGNITFAHDDIGIETVNHTINGNVLGNDFDPEGNNQFVQPVLVRTPENGSVTIDPNGNYVYVPGLDFVGNDRFVYQICDDLSEEIACDSATVYITILPTGSIGDYVWNDVNGNGVQDAAEPGMEGIVVNLFTAEGDLVDNVSTLSDGSYLFEDLAPFISYYVEFELGAYAGQLSWTQKDATNDASDSDVNQNGIGPVVYLEPLQNITNYDAGLAQYSAISGLAWHDLDGNGVQDVGEEFIAGVNVYLYDNTGAVVDQTITNPNGGYLFTNHPAGMYYVEFETPVDYSDVTFDNVGSDDEIDSDVTQANGYGSTSWFELMPGQGYNHVDAGYYKCVSIGEVTWCDYNFNDIFDDGENGVNGLLVNIWRLQDGEWELYDYTYTGHKPNTPSDDGYWSFCVIPGNYYIEIPLPPYGLVQAVPNVGNDEYADSDLDDTFGFGTTSSFSLLSGEDKMDIAAGFYNMATMGDRVWLDEDYNGIQDIGEPGVEGVTVTAYTINNIQMGSVQTDDNGNFNIDYLRKDAHYLKIEAPAQYGFTIANEGNDETDSDVDGMNGYGTTANYVLFPGEHKDLDAGLTLGSLPIELTSFYGENRGDFNFIAWETAREQNCDYYILERRFEDESTFSEIGKVKATGNTLETSKYDMNDHNIGKDGVYYYRLINVDFDGKESMSKIIAILIQRGIDNDDLNVFPNPAFNKFEIEMTMMNDSQVVIDMLDAQGRIVMKNVVNEYLKAGMHKHQVQLNNVAEGIYSLHIKQGDKLIKRKLVILR